MTKYFPAIFLCHDGSIALSVSTAMHHAIPSFFFLLIGGTQSREQVIFIFFVIYYCLNWRDPVRRTGHFYFQLIHFPNCFHFCHYFMCMHISHHLSKDVLLINILKTDFYIIHILFSFSLLEYKYLVFVLFYIPKFKITVLEYHCIPDTSLINIQGKLPPLIT